VANLELFEKLLQGVESWNRWRRDHPETTLDLSFVDLGGADLLGIDLASRFPGKAYLHGANLARSNLKDARLTGANLSSSTLAQADLRAADLREVDLSGADLRNANLGGADLTGADLRKANLLRARLRGANLTRANLSRANLGDAELGLTSFVDTVLVGAIGLESCRHFGQSYLDYFALAKSSPLPLTFLRGCGLPDQYSEYLPSMLNRAIKFYSCFISYSTKDQSFADRLYADLQARGVRCWFAPHDVMGGRKIHEQIDDAIRLHDKLLLILSQHSMASDWMRTEIAEARKKEAIERKPLLFPITIAPFDEVQKWQLFDAERGKDAAREIREYYIPDFSGWERDKEAYYKAFSRLIANLMLDDARPTSTERSDEV
jgi:uncharacterized protein YjbI with pentapeptide repeats